MEPELAVVTGDHVESLRLATDAEQFRLNIRYACFSSSHNRRRFHEQVFAAS